MAYLYVPGLEGSTSGSSWPLDIAIVLWVTSSGRPTARPSLWRGWKTRPWIALLYGTISQPSMACLTVASSISSLRASHASHSVPRPEGDESLPTCGPKCCALSEKSDHHLCSVRTCSASRSSGPVTILPPLAIERPTYRCAPPSWVPRLSADDGGYLPTLTTRGNQLSPSMQKWPAYRRLKLLLGDTSPPIFWEWSMGYPIGWTELEPLETQSYRQWQRVHYSHLHRP